MDLTKCQDVLIIIYILKIQRSLLIFRVGIGNKKIRESNKIGKNLEK